MTEEKALTVRTPTLDVWQVAMSMAPSALESRFFGVQSAEQAAMIMMKGYELGFGLTASFQFINVIQNKPALNPKGMLACIHSKGVLAGMKIEDIDKDGKPFACKVWMKRTSGFEYNTMFTMDDAMRAQLIKDGGGWDKYPANMLRWRAIGYCADIVFPDVIGGMYRPEELGAIVDAEGMPTSEFTIIEPEVIEHTVEPTAASVQEPNDTLANDTSDDAPTAANNDGIPKTLADLLALGYKPDEVMELSPKVLGEEVSVPQSEEDVAKLLAEFKERGIEPEPTDS